jgi:hypothetical protein
MTVLTKEQSMQRDTVAGLRARSAADNILSQIIHDLHLINRSWAELDVDVRNEQLRLWRAKIIDEVRAYD